MAAERFSISSFSSVTSLIVAENDSLPPRIPLGGLNLQFKSDGNYSLTVGVDNGVGIQDITSLISGGGAITADAFYRIAQFYPHKVWVNVTSIQSTKHVNVAVSL